MECNLLHLTNSNEPLLCTQIIRRMPGKRLVAFATWGNKEVVAKLFYGKSKAIQYAARERKGINALVESGISTPILYYQGASIDHKIQVMIFEKIQNFYDFNELWKKQSDSEHLKKLLHTLTIELATHHVLGILQKDMHFNNFLLTPEKIYVLDGGDIEKSNQALSKDISLKNFALFIAQLGVDAEKYRDELWHTYTESRGWKIKNGDILLLNKQIKKWQKYRWNKFQEKIFRNCSSFSKIRSMFESAVYDRNDDSIDLKNFLSNPEAVFSQQTLHILKNGRSATVIKVSMKGHDYIVKRYNIKNVWHYLRRCLRATRAAKSWRFAQYLTLMGIPTAKPVAFLQKQFLGLHGKSYFVMEEVKGMHLGEYFSQYGLSDESKKQMVTQVLELLKGLMQLQLTHGDLKMTNILVRDDKPVLIDLDGMQEHSCQYQFKRAFQKDWLRFLKNWESQPSLYKLFETNSSF